MLTQIDGSLFKKMILSAANNLANNRKMVDDLNVLPVPDGDTGTNMSMTLSSAAIEVKSCEEISVTVVADVLASASLRGARGNSGVILSQLFRGFAKGLKGYEVIDTSMLAKAFKSASDTAYKAVMKPTEGTILTVAREIAEKAMTLSQNEKDMQELADGVLRHAKIVLARTPEMLPALKQAGVVDAGGQGLVCILEGVIELLRSGDVVEKLANEDVDKIVPKEYVIGAQDIRFAYCTEFLIKRQSSKNSAEVFKSRIGAFGDSMLVIEDEDVIKVHIHTNNPGTVLQEALTIGSLTGIKIDNMREQHQSLYGKNETVEESPVTEYGFISVAMGGGIEDVLRDLGTQKIIQGGQTMNPSTEDILECIKDINAKNIFILPNNKNIILAAEQARSLTDKNVFVIPSKNIPQGIAALIAFDPVSDVETNKNNLISALDHIKTGQVTHAVRNSSFENKEIIEGDILGLNEGKIEIIGQDIHDVASQLLDSLVDDDSSIISFYYGEEINDSDAKKFYEHIEEKFPDCDVEMYKGDQPLYYYIMSVE